jgi:hypothetical protein
MRAELSDRGPALRHKAASAFYLQKSYCVGGWFPPSDKLHCNPDTIEISPGECLPGNAEMKDAATRPIHLCLVVAIYLQQQPPLHIRLFLQQVLFIPPLVRQAL